MNSIKADGAPPQMNSLDATDQFLMHERRYVEYGLRRCVETFVTRLEVHAERKKPIISEADIVTIFQSYKTIYGANKDFINQMMAVRMDRSVELRNELGKILSTFVPFLKLYIEYITKKQEAVSKLLQLTKSNKKFVEFLNINETIVQRKLKSYLDEPAARLPQYLQEVANIYVAWEAEGGSDSSAAKKSLFDAIVNIKKVTDDIAFKIKNKKARKLVAQLQKKIFNDKISLIASHRYVVTHGHLLLVHKKSANKYHFILFNDMLLIVKLKKKGANALHEVMPLMTMKIKRDPQIESALHKKYKQSQFPFGIQGILGGQIKNFVVFCESREELENWIDVIEEAVDEEEHSLHPVNPIDLQKRLKKEKNISPQGQIETITITDPVRVREINEWKKWKEAGSKEPRRRLTNLKPSARPTQKPPAFGGTGYGGGGGGGYNNNNGYGGGGAPSYNPSQPAPPSHMSSNQPGPSSPSYPPRPPSSPNNYNSNNRTSSKKNIYNSGYESPNTSNYSSNKRQSNTFNNIQPSPPSFSSPRSPPSFSSAPTNIPKYGNQPPSFNKQPSSPYSARKQSNKFGKVPGPPSFGNAPKPPSFGNAPGPPKQMYSPPQHPSSNSGYGGYNSNNNNNNSGYGGPPKFGGPPKPMGLPPSTSSYSSGPPIFNPQSKPKPVSKRNNLLGAISNFDKGSAMHHVTEEQKTNSDELTQDSDNMSNLLVNTLANYRQFVMDDDDDEDDDDDGDWD